MPVFPPHKKRSLQREIGKLLTSGSLDLWKFAGEVGNLLYQHIECDLACLALVDNHPLPHLVIRRREFTGLPKGNTAPGPTAIIRTLKIGSTELEMKDRSMMGHAACTSRAHISNDVARESFFIAPKKNIRSEVVVPVMLDGEVLGVLNCESSKSNAYGKGHLQTLRDVARRIAPVLDDLLIQRRMRTRFSEVFRKVGGLLDSVAPGIQLEDTRVLTKIAEVIARAIHCRNSAIWLLEIGESGSVLRLRGADGSAGSGVEHAVDRRGATDRWHAMSGMRPVNTPTSGSRVESPTLIVPLLSGGKSIGVIEVSEKTRLNQSGFVSFTEADRVLLQALQGQIAVSIELRRSDAGTRAQIEDQARRISGLVGIFRKAELEDVLRETVKQAQKLCDGKYCSIFLWDPDKKRFVLRASKGLKPGLIGVATYKRKEGLTGWVGHYGRLINLDNRDSELRKRIVTHRDLTWVSKYPEGGEHPNHKQLPFLAAPILVKGKSVGVIRISEKRHPGYFSRADEQVLSLVAGHLGASIWERQESQRRSDLRAKLRASRDIITGVIGKSGLGGHEQVQDSLRKAVQLAAESLKADQVCLLQLKADGAWSEAIWYPDDIDGANRDIGQTVLDEILGQGFKTSTYPKRLPGDIASSAGVLLKVGERPVGVLVLNFTSRQRFDDEDRQIIDSYSVYLALCLEIAKLAREFHQSGAREIGKDIAQDIHDAVLHMISGHVVRRLGSAKDLIRVEKYSEALHELTITEKAARHAANECRSIMNILGQHIVHDLVAALRHLLGMLDSRGAELTAELPAADGPLPLPLKLQVFRIAEAALENAISHAKADHIHLRLEIMKGEVLVTVSDDGVGFLKESVSPEDHYGLRGIKDRVSGRKGTVKIISAPGAGTTILVRVPIGGEHEDHEIHKTATAGA